MGIINKTKHDVFIDDNYDISNIDFDNREKLYYILTNMYKNPIESIVREIASNAIDATVEANNNEPIIVKLTPTTFSVQDFGTGISPEKAKNEFFKYLSSSKEGNKDLIGAWGLGSKCPLAYTDSFIVNTNYNNVKYIYLSFLNEQRIPSHKLIEAIATDERNGTTIEVSIKNGDYSEFKTAINSLNFNSNIFIDVANYVKCKIYDYELFKIEDKYVMYNTSPFILLKDIKYSIDFDIIGHEYNIELPIGIKFEAGELTPIPSRESIFYNQDSIELIRTKLKNTEEYLVKLYKQNIKTSCDTLEELFEIFDNIFEYKLTPNVKYDKFNELEILYKNKYTFNVTENKKWGCHLAFYDNSYEYKSYQPIYNVILSKKTRNILNEYFVGRSTNYKTFNKRSTVHPWSYINYLKEPLTDDIRKEFEKDEDDYINNIVKPLNYLEILEEVKKNRKKESKERKKVSYKSKPTPNVYKVNYVYRATKELIKYSSCNLNDSYIFELDMEDEARAFKSTIAESNHNKNVYICSKKYYDRIKEDFKNVIFIGKDFMSDYKKDKKLYMFLTIKSLIYFNNDLNDDFNTLVNIRNCSHHEKSLFIKLINDRIIDDIERSQYYEIFIESCRNKLYIKHEIKNSDVERHMKLLDKYIYELTDDYNLNNNEIIDLWFKHKLNKIIKNDNTDKQLSIFE